MRYIQALLFIFAGLYLVFVQAPRYEIENLSQTFIDLWGSVALLPPHLWSGGTAFAGYVLITFGVVVLVFFLFSGRSEQN